MANIYKWNAFGKGSILFRKRFGGFLVSSDKKCYDKRQEKGQGPVQWDNTFSQEVEDETIDQTAGILLERYLRYL